MRLDITKIDESISKLQEIKRIASDPELIRMLLEFVALDDTRSEMHEGPVRAADEKMLAMTQSSSGTPAGNSQDEDEAGKLLSAIAEGRDTKSGWRMRRG